MLWWTREDQPQGPPPDIRTTLGRPPLEVLEAVVPAVAGMDDRRLGGGDPRNRHPERRARHVVQPGLVEELDRLRGAAVLAADAELEPRGGLAADPGPQAHQPADPGLVDRLERAAVDDLALQIDRDELRLGVVAGEAERGLG